MLFVHMFIRPDAGDLVPGHLACSGEEHHRGGAHQPQAQHSLHRGKDNQMRYILH